MRFLVRIISTARHVMALVRKHPKKVESIGLFTVLLSGFLQLQADHYQRFFTDSHLEDIEGQVIFTRQQLMGLIECHSKGTCTDLDHIITRIFDAGRLDAHEKLDFWSSVLEEMMGERGVGVDHTTLYRWVQRYAPELEKRTLGNE